MALIKQTDTIVNNVLGAGNEIAYPGVRVQAFIGAVEQQLYSDATGTPTALVETDANGYYQFWIEEGDYTFYFSIGGAPLGSQSYSLYSAARNADTTSLATIGKLPRFTNIEGSGSPGLTVPDGGLIFIQAAGGPAGVGAVRGQRKANYTGGTPGVVNSAVFGLTEVGANVATYEWAGLLHVDSSATGGQNVGGYLKGSKRAAGPVWGGVSEVKAYVGSSGVAVAHEFDIWAIGPDPTNSRIGVDIVIGKGGQTGDSPAAFCGVRIGPQDGDTVNGSFANGLFMFGLVNAGVLLQNQGTWGILFGATSNIATGIDFAAATFSSIAMRLGRGQAMSLEGTNTAKFEAFGAGDSVAKFTFSGSEKVGFDVQNGTVRISGTKVLGARDVGWAAMTGTGNKNTVYDTSSVTLPQLAGRVAQLQAALTTHGIIGT